MKIINKALLSAVALMAISVSGKAEAEGDFYFSPYLGLEYQRTVIDYGSFEGISFDSVYEDGFNGGKIYLGAKVHDNLGVELGYSRTKEEDKNNVLNTGINTSLQFQSFTLDLMGYYPVSQIENLELIGSLGLAHTKAEVEIDATSVGFTTARGDESETKIRIGAGAQYELAENWNVRGMIHWQDTDFDNTANDAFIFGLGINYKF